MNPIEWLSAKAPGFKELAEDDRLAIMHFSLLWSLFEARALDTNASATRLCALVHQWEGKGMLDAVAFARSLAYFKDRYFQNGMATEHFRGLNLRRNDEPSLVEAVLKGENTNPIDGVIVLLIVVFRLRNNLFHGAKWAYGISDQLGNFTHANATLMSALDIHER